MVLLVWVIRRLQISLLRSPQSKTLMVSTTPPSPLIRNRDCFTPKFARGRIMSRTSSVMLDSDVVVWRT